MKSRPKKILILGSGGREHALAVKCATDLKDVSGHAVIVAPGNDGMSFERWPCDFAKGTGEFERLAQLASQNSIDLVIVGPDQALADGVVDVFNQYSIACFGPTQAAAEIEFSKSFSKRLMKSAGIRTADFEVIREAAQLEHLFRLYPGIHSWVVKLDGLALGKGVRVCRTLDETREAAQELLALGRGPLVVEQKLQGEELSWLAFCDGENVALFEPARDYKRLTEDSRSPNTGGMGAYSPVAPYGSEWADRIEAEVFLPVLREMKNQGREFRGILYAGLMIDGKNYGVLEFNARMGDPETQALLPRMKSSFVDYAWACTQKNLSQLSKRVEFDSRVSVFVVAAAPGYPGEPQKGAPLRGHVNQEGLYFAGVRAIEGGQLVSSGGRVFGALGMAARFEEARQLAYERLKNSGFEQMQFRNDIGKVNS